MLCLVAQLCLTLCDPVDCSLPGSSVRGDSPGKNTGVGCHDLLQGIFPTQGSNSGLSCCRRILYSLNHQGSPYIHTYIHTVTYLSSGVLIFEHLTMNQTHSKDLKIQRWVGHHPCIQGIHTIIIGNLSSMKCSMLSWGLIFILNTKKRQSLVKKIFTKEMTDES